MSADRELRVSVWTRMAVLEGAGPIATHFSHEADRWRAAGHEVTEHTNLVAASARIEELQRRLEAATLAAADMAYASQARPSCQAGMIARCRCMRCSTDRVKNLDDAQCGRSAAHHINGEIARYQDEIDDLRVRLTAAEREAEKAKPSSLERECMRIGTELQRAADQLPKCYELEVHVEQGAGWVYLYDADGVAQSFNDVVDGLSHCITAAIDASLNTKDPTHG